MLHRGNFVRFTASEMAEFRTLGIEFHGVQTRADIERAIVWGAEELQAQRPDLLEKIATEMGTLRSATFAAQPSIRQRPAKVRRQLDARACQQPSTSALKTTWLMRVGHHRCRFRTQTVIFS